MLGNFAEGTVNAKALGPEQAWHVGGTAMLVPLIASNGWSAPSLGVDMISCREARYKRNVVLHICPMCVAVDFLFYDHTVFLYLAPGQMGFPIFILPTSVEMSHYSIGIPDHHLLDVNIVKVSITRRILNFNSPTINPSVKSALTHFDYYSFPKLIPISCICDCFSSYKQLLLMYGP